MLTDQIAQCGTPKTDRTGVTGDTQACATPLPSNTRVKLKATIVTVTLRELLKE